jgi:hypothetical protein
MPTANKKLRLDALAREQRFVDIPYGDNLSEYGMKNYIESFTTKLIHQQKKIHLLLTELILQELKLVYLFTLPKYKNVVTMSILCPGNQKSSHNIYNTKPKVEAGDVLKYLKTIDIKASWDDVTFLIKRFLHESPYFRVNNPMRWDWQEMYYESDDTHFESDDDIKLDTSIAIKV